MKDSDLKDLIKKIKLLEEEFNVHLHQYRYILECADSLWEMSPFKIGDLVKLNKTPDITAEKSWGWMCAKHFLVKGALATVKERKFYDGRFVYGLIFQDETWIDRNGIKQPVDSKGLFMFGESWLEAVEPVGYNQLSCEAL